MLVCTLLCVLSQSWKQFWKNICIPEVVPRVNLNHVAITLCVSAATFDCSTVWVIMYTADMYIIWIYAWTCRAFGGIYVRRIVNSSSENVMISSIFTSLTSAIHNFKQLCLNSKHQWSKHGVHLPSSCCCPVHFLVLTHQILTLLDGDQPHPLSQSDSIWRVRTP